MTEQERSLLNEQTMLGSRDRTFCGIELQPVTAVNRRYIERMISMLGRLSYTPSEVALSYALMLSIPLASLRRVCRDMDLLDQELDAFIKKLPAPLPQAELENLNRIVEGDIAEIKAAQVKVEPKPKDPAELARESAEPPNS